jgi:thiol-disulfide isomerase/thioredoxin
MLLIDFAKRALALGAIATSSCFLQLPVALGAEKLGVGSVAPPLNVEHWIHESTGTFPKVTQFEKGKVYVVEFWATTCGPCVQSMPHLAALQSKYKDKGLRIISISSEKLPIVNAFLKREIPDLDGKPVLVGELTKAYSLTTDPDESSDIDYMLAANQDGIPCAFIVGKDSKIEWIGHPMEMEAILDSVIEGTWDREKYVAEQNLIEEVQKTIGALARKKQYAEAVTAIEGFTKRVDDKRLLFGLLKSKVDLQLMAKSDVKQIAETYASLFKTCEAEPFFTQDVAWTAYEKFMQKMFDDKSILESSIQSLERVTGLVQGADRANLMDTLGHLNHAIGRFEAAVAAQTKAVELSDGTDQGTFKEFLEEIKSDMQKSVKK